MGKEKNFDLASERWAFKEGDIERRGMSTIFLANDPDFLVGYAICECRNLEQRKEDIARVRLITAAPEMHDTIMQFLEVFAEGVDDFNDVAEKFEALIAKIQGN